MGPLFGGIIFLMNFLIICPIIPLCGPLTNIALVRWFRSRLPYEGILFMGFSVKFGGVKIVL